MSIFSVEVLVIESITNVFTTLTFFTCCHATTKNLKVFSWASGDRPTQTNGCFRKTADRYAE